MKKFLMALMAVLFLGATSLVLADEPAAGTATPAAAAAKGHKGSKHKVTKKSMKAKKTKKAKKAKKAEETAPANTGAPAAAPSK